MNRILYSVAFVTGLVAIGWVGAGYVHANTLALAITALIAAFYLIGSLELRRFDQATGTDRALARLAEPPASLGDWLGRCPLVRSAVRLRIEGERVALPGPALTPYLVGLLVLLGMLGTFLAWWSRSTAPASRWSARPTCRRCAIRWPPGQGPRARVRHFGGRGGGVGDAGADVGAVPAPAPAGAQRLDHASPAACAASPAPISARHPSSCSGSRPS